MLSMLENMKDTNFKQRLTQVLARKGLRFFGYSKRSQRISLIFSCKIQKL